MEKMARCGYTKARRVVGSAACAMAILAGMAVLAASGCQKKSDQQVLNVNTWTGYLPQDVLDAFTAKTGIKVNVSTMESNEELLAKLQAGNTDYDVVVPSDYMVRIMAKTNLIQPLDRAKITNWGNLDPAQLDLAYDPGNKYSIPFFWGTTGIGYNKKRITDPVDSWRVLFEPKYAGEILMCNDVRECFAAALKLNGKSLNDTNPADLKDAADLLIQQKKLVKAYDSDDYDNKLRTGEVLIAQGFNGQFAKLAHEKPEVFAYVVPKEGATRWVDNLSIPANSKHTEAAYTFINFILEPEQGAKIVNFASYASANKAAAPRINAEILHDPAIYAPADVLKRCEFLEDVGDATKTLDKYWTEIKSQ